MSTAGGRPLGRDGRVPYNAALDGLRACAVVPVMVFHFTARVYLSGGFLGVDIFFVISGYLITTLLVVDQSRTRAFRYAHFYARRALRLLPAIAAVLIFGGLLSLIHPLHGDRSYLVAVLATLALAQGVVLSRGGLGLPYIGHLWTLDVEIVFYVLWPLVVDAGRRLNRRRAIQILAGATLAVAILKASLFPAIGYLPEYFLFPFRLDDFFVGALLALLAPAAATGLSHRRVAALDAAAWVAAVVLTVLMVTPHLAHPHSGYLYRYGGGTVVAVLAGVLIAATCLASDRSFARVLAWGPLPGIGLLSYGLYLWHEPVNTLLGDTMRVSLRAIVGIPLSFVLAYLSKRFIENPALRLRRREPLTAETTAPARAV